MRLLSRRRFLGCAAGASLGATAGQGAAQSALQGTPPERAESSAAPRLRVCLVSGSLEYKSDESLAAFQEHLEKRFSVTCSRAFRKADDDLPGLEHLEHCDCAVLFTRRLTITGQQLERIQRYLQGGGPVVAIRTASHGFQNWLAMDKEVLGGDYSGHYGNQFKPRIHVVPEAKDHPVLAGVEPFVSGGSLYKNPHLAPDTTLLMTGSIPGHTEPVTWTRLNRGGRVLYTSLGHPDDFQQPSFLRLLVNGMFWVCHRTPA